MGTSRVGGEKLLGFGYSDSIKNKNSVDMYFLIGKNVFVLVRIFFGIFWFSFRIGWGYLFLFVFVDFF